MKKSNSITNTPQLLIIVALLPLVISQIITLEQAKAGMANNFPMNYYIASTPYERRYIDAGSKDEHWRRQCLFNTLQDLNKHNSNWPKMAKKLRKKLSLDY